MSVGRKHGKRRLAEAWRRHHESFREEMANPRSSNAILHAALSLVPLEEPDLPPGWRSESMEAFDAMVEGLPDSVTLFRDASPRDRVAALARHFTQTLGFSGNRQTYHDPANSSIRSVLKTRQGLPITLAIILISLGERAGLPLHGVSSPGHFLTAATLPGEKLYIDPFNGSELLTEPQAKRLISEQSGIAEAAVPPFLGPATREAIVVRMLNNLKVAYLHRGDLSRLLESLNWLLSLDPDNVTERRNRGLILLREGETQAGLTDLLAYVQSSPGAEDLELIREEILRARGGITKKN